MPKQAAVLVAQLAHSRERDSSSGQALSSQQSRVTAARGEGSAALILPELKENAWTLSLLPALFPSLGTMGSMDF